MFNRPRHTGRIAKLLLLTLCVGAAGFTHIQTISGATYGVATYPSIKGCPINERFDNWNRVIQDGASFSDFYENWADLFTRNSCQQSDIFALEKQIEGTQNQLRLKIFSCQDGQLNELSQKIHDLQFELEYIRNVLDTDDERPAPDGGKGVIRQPGKLMQLLQESSIVKSGHVTGAHFTKLFNDLQAKYATRVKDYQNCKDQNWEMLGKKWNEFVNSWGGIKPAAQQSAKATKTRFNQLLETPSDRTGHFLNGFLDIRVNNVTPQQNFDAIYKQLESYNGTSGKTGGTSGTNGSSDSSQPPASKTAPTSWNFLDRVVNEYYRYKAQEDQTKRHTYYEVLYKETGDASGAAIIEEVTNLNKIITDTFAVTNNVRKCVKYIADKQCRGK